MRIIVVIFICILFSNCNRDSSKLNGANNLKNTIWIDSLCNEFHFKDSTFIKRGLFMKESIFDEIGKLNLNKEIELLFDYDNNEIKKFYLESNLEGKLVFKPLDKYSDYITLFKKDSIENTGLKIEELKLKVEPLFLSSSGITELIITKDKKTEYRRIENNCELEVITFSDSAFHQLEQYLEILKFDKYKEIYNFPGFDGTNYELNLKTNLYSKTIKCIQRPTEGLRNLMSFIYLKLQTEQKITTN